jgi:hypothetical protein
MAQPAPRVLFAGLAVKRETSTEKGVIFARRTPARVT